MTIPRVVRRWWFLSLLVAGMGTYEYRPLPAVIPVRNTPLPAPPFAPSVVTVEPRLTTDTLRLTVAWGNPASNGTAYDSIRVGVFNLAAGGWLRRNFVPPFPTTTAFDQFLSWDAGVQSATYPINAVVCVYQGAGRACADHWTSWTYTRPITLPPPDSVTVAIDSAQPVTRVPSFHVRQP